MLILEILVARHVVAPTRANEKHIDAKYQTKTVVLLHIIANVVVIVILLRILSNFVFVIDF